MKSGLAAIGFERSFGIITAANPGGVGQPAHVNEALDAKLQREIARLRVHCVAVDACNPDRSHCEPSIAIALDLQPLVALACQYAQLALFWFDGDAFWIVPALGAVSAQRLPV